MTAMGKVIPIPIRDQSEITQIMERMEHVVRVLSATGRDEKILHLRYGIELLWAAVHTVADLLIERGLVTEAEFDATFVDRMRDSEQSVQGWFEDAEVED